MRIKLIINKKDFLFKIYYFFCFVVLNPSTYITTLFRELYIPFLFFSLIVLVVSIIAIGSKKNKINASLILSIIYIFIVYMIDLFLRGYQIRVYDTIQQTALLLLVYAGYTLHKKSFIAGASNYFLVMAIIMVVMQIAYPNGIGSYYYLFENKNILIRFFLPGLCFVLLDSCEKGKKLISCKNILYSTLFIYIIIYTGSVTSIIGLFLFAVQILLFVNRGVPKVLNLDKTPFFSMAIFIGIFFFRIQNSFEKIIVNLFNKDLTFHGRIIIWEAAVKSIRNNIFLGIGYSSRIQQDLYGFPHAHQYWLQILLVGGILGFGIILSIYIYTGRKIQWFLEKKDVVIIVSAINSFLIMGIDEALVHADMLLPLLVLLCQMGVYYSDSKLNDYKSIKSQLKILSFFRGNV